MYQTCGVHSKLTNSQIVLDKSLFLFSSWFSNASLNICSISHTRTYTQTFCLISNISGYKTREPSLNVLTQLPFNFSGIHGVALLSTVSRSNWNLKMLVFVEGGKHEYPEKNHPSRDENQQQTQPTYDVEYGNRTPEPHRWEASALTTAPSLPPPSTVVLPNTVIGFSIYIALFPSGQEHFTISKIIIYI